MHKARRAKSKRWRPRREAGARTAVSLCRAILANSSRAVLLRLALGIIVGFLVGGFAGYMLGIYVACAIFEAGNLCGLVGVFITGPLGALAGSIAGGLLSQRRPAQK